MDLAVGLVRVAGLLVLVVQEVDMAQMVLGGGTGGGGGPGGGGGSGGAATSGNGNVTWSANGTRNGSLG